MMEAEKNSRYKILNILALLLSLGILFFLASYAFLIWESPNRLILIFIPLVLILWTVMRMQKGKFLFFTGKWCHIVGTAFIALLAFSAYYFYRDYHLLLFERAANNNNTDMFLGAVLLVLVVIMTWQETGPPIPIVMMIFVAYGFWGNYLPEDSILYHGGINFTAFMRFAALSPDGIFGTLPIAGFTLVTIFLFLSGLVRGFGSLDYIINFSVAITKNFRWGLPQIPVVSSLVFGSFSGAAAANVAGTGAFTIPMMKKFGVQPKEAAAIESVASTGGQVMPPILGVAAFLMADFLGVPYLRIVLISIPPALVFYLCVAFSVYLITQDLPITHLSRAEREKLIKDFRLIDGLPLALSIFVLVFFLTYFRSSVLVSGMWMLLSYLFMQLLFHLFRSSFSLSSLRHFFGKVAAGILEGGASTVGIIGMLATMGVIAKMLTVTGLSQSLSFLMVDLSHGNLIFLLPLIFIASIGLGMAVSTVVVYIMVVLLATPALLSYGIAPHIAHFMVFYLATLGNITPPVAIAVAIGCGIAKSKFFATGIEAVKIGLPLFVLPFLFIYKPDLLAGNLSTTPLAFLEVLVGLLAVTYAIHSKSKGVAGFAVRFVFAGLGIIGIILQGLLETWSCLGMVAILSLVYYLWLRKKSKAKNLQPI